MINRQTLAAINPSWGSSEFTDNQVATYVQKTYYPDYDPETFRSSFLKGNATPTAEDVYRIDSTFRDAGTKGQLFAFVNKKKGFGELDDEKLAEARAVFMGEAEDRSWGEVAPDLGIALAQGATGVVGGTAELARLGDDILPGLGIANLATAGINKVTGLDIPTTGEVGGYISDKASEFSDFLQDYKSDSLKQETAIQQSASAEREAQGMNWALRAGYTVADIAANPALLGDQSAQSAAYLAPGALLSRGGAVIGAAVGKGRQLVGGELAKLQAKYAGTTMAAGMGALEGADAAVGTRQKVIGMTHEQLMEGSEKYRGLIEDKVNPDIAREMVALSASRTTFAITAPIAGFAGKLTSKFESGILRGKASSGGPGIKATGMTLLREGAEEIIQEGINALGGNMGVKLYADESQELLEGTAEAVGAGFIGGVSQTGAFKAVEAAGTRLSGRQPEIRRARDILDRASKGEATTFEEQVFVESVYPDLRQDIFENSNAEAQTEAFINPSGNLTNGQVLDTIVAQAEAEGRDFRPEEKAFIEGVTAAVEYATFERMAQAGLKISAEDQAKMLAYEEQQTEDFNPDAAFRFQDEGAEVEGGMNYPETYGLVDEGDGLAMEAALGNLALKYKLAGGGQNTVAIPESDTTLSDDPQSAISLETRIDKIGEAPPPAGPAVLTDGEVYEAVMRGAEGRELLSHERDFIDSMGDPAAPFLHQGQGQEYVGGTTDFPAQQTLERDNEGFALSTAVGGLESRYAANTRPDQGEAVEEDGGIFMPRERSESAPLVSAESQVELKKLNPVELAAYMQQLQETITEGEALTEYEAKVQGFDLAKLRAEAAFASTLKPKFKTKADAQAAADAQTEGRWEVVKNEEGRFVVQPRDATALEAELESLRDQGQAIDEDWAARIIDPKAKAISTTEFKTEKGAKLSLVQKQKQHGGNWEVTTDGTKFYLSPRFVSPAANTSTQVQSEMFGDSSSSPVNSSDISESSESASSSSPVTSSEPVVSESNGVYTVELADGSTETISVDKNTFKWGGAPTGSAVELLGLGNTREGIDAAVKSLVNYKNRMNTQGSLPLTESTPTAAEGSPDQSAPSPVSSKTSLTQSELGKIEIEMDAPTEDGEIGTVTENAGVAYQQATDKISAFEAILKCCKASK